MLSFIKIEILGSPIGSESSLPSVAPMLNVQTQKNMKLDETNELFLDLGKVKNLYPYRQQNQYGRELSIIKVDAAILENKSIKAVFLPGFGGRLWQLYDKKNNRDLLYKNDAMRPCNLALRNAWFSGGIEWNIGLIGHSPFTCSPLFAAKVTAEDGTTVLRMYEYERIRNITYQMDFFLRGDSDQLFCRMRIVNLNASTIPMYWWSNVAVPENPNARMIVPAEQSYYSYLNVIGKTSIPIRNGVDVSYPVKTRCAMDYFYYIPDKKRKYMAYVDETGTGLLQTSTTRLKGRKLFVWGQTDGSKTWQHFLTDNGGNYVEIQAGIGRTQYECIPMPPKAAWEWIEVYSPVNIDPKKAHGSWNKAQDEIDRVLSSAWNEDELEKMLDKTKADFVFRSGEVFHYGSEYGLLENYLRKSQNEEPISKHLSFETKTNMHSEIKILVDKGVLPSRSIDEVPEGYLYGDRWFYILKKAATRKDSANWYTQYLYGMMLLQKEYYGEAEKAFKASLILNDSCWGYYGMFVVKYSKGQYKNGMNYLKKAVRMNPNDISLVRECFRYMTECNDYKYIFQSYHDLSSTIREDSRIKYYLSNAYARSGMIEQAEEILYGDGGLVIPDIREGETTITDLWDFIEQQKQKSFKAELRSKVRTPPQFLNFRMEADTQGDAKK